MMPANLTLRFVILLLFLLIPQTTDPCTTFGLDDGDQHIFGKNYDWHLERGLLIVNKRGVVKQAQPHLSVFSDQYARWTSKYGSLTFNQYGREIPTGGMNEKGLVVHLMNLNATQFPKPDSRPCIHSLQWIQYQLDRHSTVAEVIASDRKIRMYPNTHRIHYLVKDRTGACASIEYLFGKLVYHTTDTMPVKVLANSTYADSIKYLKKHEGFGGKDPVSNRHNSLDRFTRAAVMLRNFQPGKKSTMVEYAFEILAGVAQPHTQWRIVYDQTALRAYFRTAKNEKMRYVNLTGFDFSCNSPVRILDISADLSGDVTDSFSDYSQQLNKDLINDALKGTHHLKNTPKDRIEELSKYPDNATSCQ